MKQHNEISLKQRFVLILFIGFLTGIIGINSCITSMAADCAEDMAVYPGVMVSPDQTAWTTDYMDRTNERMPEGYTISTGQSTGLRELETGEHYYKAATEGSIPIGKWVVAWPNAQCIHYYKAQNYKGFQVKEGICEKYYNNGWNAYCADCNEVVADMLFYAKSDTVKGILSMPAQSCYLYVCPHCEGLEQGSPYQHMCKKISYNRYIIRYDENAPADTNVNGYMAVTRHMYQNATVYEGMDAAAIGYSDKKLRKNNYEAQGYIFCGWNTAADGTGEAWEDGQEIINLSSENHAVVVLYAQWEKAESTLCIDPGGGIYNGNEGITSVTKKYGETYALDSGKLVPPEGYVITFEANGGTDVDDLRTEKSLYIWQKGDDFQGDFEENVYTFSAQDRHTDRVTAIYQDVPFSLPQATKPGYIFGGWYEDEACTEFVGHPGEEMTADCDMTLYARWSELVLTAIDDYESYDGSGAVDLYWFQPEEKEKYYKLYQSVNKTEWEMIYDADTITNSVTNVAETIDYYSSVKTYLVQRAGYYTLSAFGAKGGDLGTLQGGAGGYTTATYWLKKGDIITIYGGTAGGETEGGVNDSIANGGAANSIDGAGGGAATEIYITRNGIKDLLMIAGGGGGANVSYAGGMGGDSLTSVNNSAGADSVNGGSGGGAQGGAANGGRVLTTIDNPAMEDIAFMSHIPKTYRNYSNHAITGYMGENKTGYPVYETDIQDRAPWYRDAVQVIGDLNREISITDTERYKDEYHYNTSTNRIASVGKSPYFDCFQAGRGFARTFTATYPTNGNTNLVLSAGQQTSWRANRGYIEFIVTDADTDTEIQTIRVVEADAKYDDYRNSDGDISVSGHHMHVGCWTDIRIPEGVENVTITAKIYIFASTGHTNAFLTDTYFYGKEIASIGPTMGGTSYINTGYGCKNQTYEGGKNSGDGYGMITGKIEAYLEQNFLENVRARDMQAPAAVVLKQENIKTADDNMVNVTWEEPKDRGTVYYHKCESYFGGAKELESNVTKNTIATGVKGYYYYVDLKEIGIVTTSDIYVENKEHMGKISIPLHEREKYLHVAAVDYAGNLGDTANIKLGAEEETMPWSVHLFTEQLSLEETDFVYPADEKSWFVKADGVTEHMLNISVGIEDGDIDLFQVDRVRLHANNGVVREWLQTAVPRGDPALSEEIFLNSELNMNMSDYMGKLLQPGIALSKRTNHAVRLTLKQNFSLSQDASEIYLYPEAVAECEGEEYVSEGEQDILHGLTIIPDGRSPEIAGLEELRKLKVLDMTEQSKQITLRATDDLSGLQEFVLMLHNRDNHTKAEFLADNEGWIEVEIQKENPLFVGELSITALAVDRVGNATVIGEEGLTFTLETDLYKEKNPEEHIFKTGEGAILEIATSGYVERIEVIFPDELLGVEQDLNCTYEYEYPALRNKESLKFHIPLGIAEREYEITVKAYKNGQVLISKPTFVVVEGTVLDELRTRIRNNG